jgi:uncharacterized protein (DUF885 family)
MTALRDGVSRRTVAAALGAGALLTGCGRGGQSAPDAWSGLVGDLTAQAFADAPEAAALAPDGVRPARPLAALGDRSVAGEELRRTAALRRLAQLASFDVAETPPAARRRHAALLERAKAIAGLAALPFGRLDPDGAYRPYAIDPAHGAHVALPALCDSGPPFAGLAEAQAYLERARRMPAALAGDTAKLQSDAAAGFIPPLPVLDRAIVLIEALAGLPLAASPYRTAFISRALTLAGPLDGPDPSGDVVRLREVLGALDALIRDQIAPQYQRASQALRALRPRAPGQAGFARAPDALVAYQRALDAAIAPALDLTLQRGHAETRLAALIAELDPALRGQGLTEGGVGARLAQLRTVPRADAADPEAARAAILAEVSAASAAAGVAFANGFGPLAPPALSVARAPAWREALGLGPAYRRAVPGPPARAEALLHLPLSDPARLTPLELAGLAWKEGAPGRHLAHSLMGVSGDVAAPLLALHAPRSVIEGWCAYALDLALEMGLAQADPLARIGALRAQLLSAAAALLELDLNAAGAAYDPAIARYIDATGATRFEADRTAERILSEPGAGLAGEVGRHHIAGLKDRARAALGPRFDAKSFHTALLAAMPGPLTYLTAGIEDWIARL